MRYIGLLRAVNVGGRNKIKMADLRSALDTIDLQHVRTYIQSGNILFASDLPENAVQQRIEHQIEQHFGFQVDSILRSLTDFDRLIASCPFVEPAGPGSSSSAPAGLAVVFLSRPPNQEAIESLARYTDQNEQYRVVGRDVYVLLPHGTARSKLVTQVQKLGPTATLRNWKTVQKLHTLAHAHE